MKKTYKVLTLALILVFALSLGAFADYSDVLVVFEEDWSAIMNLNRQAPMPDDGYEPLYLRGGITGWGADENFKLTTTDGNYYSAYYEAGSEVEITGAFKIASGSVDWAPYNFGGNFLVKAGENILQGIATIPAPIDKVKESKPSV